MIPQALARRLASTAAQLGRMLAQPSGSEEETILRGVLRRDLARLAQLVEEAAFSEADPASAADLADLALRTQRLAQRPSRTIHT